MTSVTLDPIADLLRKSLQRRSHLNSVIPSEAEGSGKGVVYAVSDNDLVPVRIVPLSPPLFLSHGPGFWGRNKYLTFTGVLDRVSLLYIRAYYWQKSGPTKSLKDRRKGEF